MKSNSNLIHLICPWILQSFVCEHCLTRQWKNMPRPLYSRYFHDVKNLLLVCKLSYDSIMELVLWVSHINYTLHNSYLNHLINILVYSPPFFVCLSICYIQISRFADRDLCILVSTLFSWWNSIGTLMCNIWIAVFMVV